MKQLIIFTLILLMMGLFSCMKNTAVDNIGTTDPTTKTMRDLTVPSSFEFKTTKEVALGILIKNPTSVMSDVPVSVYLDYPGSTESPNPDARLYGTYVSQSDGRIDEMIKLPLSQDSIYLATDYIGLENESGIRITGNIASYTFGTGNTIKSASISDPSGSPLKAAPSYTFMGSFNAQGVPGYLMPTNDVLDKYFLIDLNASIPEKGNVPLNHPQFLASGIVGDVILNQKADVWITFVSEGAGFTNAIGYFTYNPATPPQKISDIANLKIIFPNVSLNGTGGGLLSGNKVHLGLFDANTALGWFIVANGWNGTTVNGSILYFSDPVLNVSETNALKHQHTVLINDTKRSLFILGFEDMNRSTGGSDNDFNDEVFYITTNPVSAIKSENIPVVVLPSDDDKDGVTNTLDEFPNDPARAHTSYYPAKNQYNSLLVEDLWPSLGDFDFNDMVVDCNYENVTNAQNNVVETYIKLKVRAIGASFKNGFGIQLPIAPSAVSSVTLTDQSGINSSIGVEAGQDKAVVIAFNDAFKLLPSTGGTGVNVIPGNGVSTPKEITLHILFATPQTVANLGTAPFNPFIYVNGDRTKEVHLPMAKPTTKANVAFFGTSSDTSNPATGRYYKSSNNLVWMMEVPSSFQYTIETNDITKSYLKFGAWAESGGTQFTDWYLDKTGYRNSSLIYK